MDGAEIAVGLGMNMEWLHFLSKHGNCCSIPCHGAGRWLSHTPGRQGNSSPLAALAALRAYPARTDACTSCTGVSGDHAYLFRSDKNPFCCCTLGSSLGIILP